MKTPHFLFTAFSAFLLLLAALVIADDTVVHGSIEFEEDIKRKKTYAETQEEVIEKISLLSSFTADATKQPELEDLVLDDDHLVYLNALYLYCSVHRGTCPSVLNTVLEIDVITSRVKGTVGCRTMKRFWKTWIANDMEKRHQHQVKTGLMKETQKFRKEELPRYLRCSDTVARELERNADSTSIDFFYERYKLPSVARQAVTDTLGAIEDAKKSKTNLLFVTGTKR